MEPFPVRASSFVDYGSAFDQNGEHHLHIGSGQSRLQRSPFVLRLPRAARGLP
jgi:hypothetical protein